MNAAPLYGLVLAGGHSTRMQRDKATLEYAGESQLQRAMSLLVPWVEHAFVSIRPDQRSDPQRAAFDTIADLTPGLGPVGGIQAALHAHPHSAWLVLACDLPFLGAQTLRNLVEHRDASRLATAYRSNFNDKPEPLCAIYEPASREAIDAWISQGQTCPRKWLLRSDVVLLDLPEPRALDNVNTTAEYADAVANFPAADIIDASGPRSASRRLQVRYFALLREQAGRSSEALQTGARTPQELYAQLQRERGLKLAPEFLRVAINDEFGEWQQPLHDGDSVAFLPPVAGG
ncbi:MAG: NTP transferase domain-containing protein [Steroidobacteraceae bacterium]